MTTHRSLEEKLRAGGFVLTAEVTPPVSCRRGDLLAKAAPLRGLADAVNITDGAGARVHMAAVTAAGILQAAGIEPILQLTCRDRNRIALQSELLAASALGIRNLLMLRGDDPSAGDQPDAKPVFDVDARELMRTAARLRDRGELPNGRAIAGHPHFFIGGADNPVDPQPGWSAKGLLAKIEAGAQFVQTQFCMDAGVVRRYLQRLADEGILARVFFIIGVVPLRSVRSARWIKDNLFGSIIPDAAIARMDKAEDPAREGKHILLEHLEALAEIPGVAGVHIMAPGNDEVVPEIIAETRKRIGNGCAAAVARRNSASV